MAQRVAIRAGCLIPRRVRASRTYCTWCYSSAATKLDATRWFARWARNESVTDAAPCDAVRQMRAGLVDADLGGGLVKKRVARAGQGKSGGYRTLIATNKADRWVFVYGFPKSERSNIDATEVAALKKLAEHLLSLSAQGMAKARRAGELIEVNCDA